MKIILILVVLASCQPTSHEEDTKESNALSEKIESRLASADPNIIDTSLAFPSIDSFITYKNAIDKNVRTNILKNDSISFFDKEKVEITNSVLAHYAFYKILRTGDKSLWSNFKRLGFIVSSHVFSQQELSELFNLFPADYRNNELGKKYLKIISEKDKSLGKSINDIRHLKLKTRDGSTIELGSVIDEKYDFHIIMFTASWCSPCIYYSKVHKSKLEKIDAGKTNLLSISIDKDEARWKKFITEEGYTWSCYLDAKGFDSPLFKHFKLGGIPAYLLLNRQGKVIEQEAGNGIDIILNRIGG